MAVKTTLTRIGNSRGIRIPKTMVEQLGFQHEVELAIDRGALIVKPVKTVRQGWEEAAKAMNKAKDDDLLDETTSTEFDKKDWTW